MSYTLDIHQTVKTCVKIYNSNFPNFPNADAHLNSYTGYCKYKYWTTDKTTDIAEHSNVFILHKSKKIK